MAVVALKIKVMPEGLDTDLEKVQTEAEKKLIEKGAIKVTFEIQEIAFGLKALIVTIAWPEKEETAIAETALKEISGVLSVETIDYRRAFG